MDLLSEILSDAHWKSDLLARTSFFRPWGLHFPCDRSAGFHIISQGTCYVRFKGKDVKLERGDILLIARGCRHDLISDPSRKAVDIARFRERMESEEALEGRQPVTTFVSVRYEIPDGPVHPFFLELPDFILVRSEEIPAHHPLQTTLILISQEIDSGIGSDLILQKLSDILLYYVIRHWMQAHPVAAPGWRNAFHDQKIRSALETIHRKPAHGWTLDELARSVGISRASLANRFREVLGITPMGYLARLRIEKGRTMLRHSDTTLEEVAREVGYSSAFAYSKAYKRIRGAAPTHEEQGA